MQPKHAGSWLSVSSTENQQSSSFSSGVSEVGSEEKKESHPFLISTRLHPPHHVRAHSFEGRKERSVLPRQLRLRSVRSTSTKRSDDMTSPSASVSASTARLPSMDLAGVRGRYDPPSLLMTRETPSACCARKKDTLCWASELRRAVNERDCTFLPSPPIRRCAVRKVPATESITCESG